MSKALEEELKGECPSGTRPGLGSINNLMQDGNFYTSPWALSNFYEFLDVIWVLRERTTYNESRLREGADSALCRRDVHLKSAEPPLRGS